MPKLHSVIKMTTYNQRLSIPPDDVNTVHEFLQSIWDENSYIPTRDKYSVETAIIELTSNIILYSDATSGIICEIVIEALENRIDATISDNGELADLALDEHIMPDEFSESGRGIPLIKTLVDEFVYENSENRNMWRISKKFRS